MRGEFSEPAGMYVRDKQGKVRLFTFPDFVGAIERAEVLPEDEVRSHIVTRDRWVHVGQMRLYGKIMENLWREKAAQDGAWLPAPQF